MKRKPDPLIKCQPWRMTAVFGPIERIIHRLEADGTVEVAGCYVVFKDDGNGGWYDAVVALRGVIQFHELAATRHGLPIDLAPMIKFANKLDAGTVIFEQDIADLRGCIDACKRQALQLRISQANDIINTVRISAEMDKIMPAPAANKERAAGTAQGAGALREAA